MCYSAISNVRWHYSTILKQNNIFLFRVFNVSATFSPFILSVSHLFLHNVLASLITSLSLTVAYTNRCLSCFSSTGYHCLAWVWQRGPLMVLWLILLGVECVCFFFAWFLALNSDWLDQMQGAEFGGFAWWVRWISVCCWWWISGFLINCVRVLGLHGGDGDDEW